MNFFRDHQRSATDGNAAQRRINHGHVGAAQLGTCDEAGGGPTTPQRLKFTTANEAAWERVRDAIRARPMHRWAAHAFSGTITAIGGALTVGLWVFS